LTQALLIPQVEIEKPILSIPAVPENWDYENSIKKIKSKMFKWKNMTGEVLDELWIAREVLSAQGGYQFHKKVLGTNVPSTWDQYCEDIGIEKRTANRWLKRYEEPSIHFSSESSEWTTPELIIKKTVELFGKIDLDPCSNTDFPNIPATMFFDKTTDGLKQNWHGKVYMNPPYGTVIKKWIEKACDEHEKTNTIETIILVPSRTDTIWFRRMKIYLRCFIWGRLKFGGNETSAPFPSMIVYLGNRKKEFIKVFSDIGDVYGLQK